MSQSVHIFEGTVRHQQTIFMLKILTILRRALDGLFHEGRVFRINPFEKKLHGRFRRLLVLEDLKGFLRPEEFSASNTPAESTGVTESLSFCQATLTPSELSFCVFALGNLSINEVDGYLVDAE